MESFGIQRQWTKTKTETTKTKTRKETRKETSKETEIRTSKETETRTRKESRAESKTEIKTEIRTETKRKLPISSYDRCEQRARKKWWNRRIKNGVVDILFVKFILELTSVCFLQFP